MNFQPPDPEDDPRDDDQRMRDAELEAHRVRFEQQSGEPETMKGQRRGDGYANHSDTRTWQAYQCGIADADRAQRAAPGVQGGEPTPWRNEMMDMAIAAGVAPNTIFHFEAAFLRFAESLEKKINTAQPPQQSAQPVAWMHETPGRVDVIHDEVKKLLSAVATDYLYRPIDKSEKYTIPLYAAAQPVEVQPLTPAEQDAADWIYRLNAPDRYADRVAAFCAWMGRNGIKPTSSEGGAA